MNTITNPELMRELAHGTATYAVRIALAQNPAPGAEARNPYLWSAAAGSALPVSSGSLCQARSCAPRAAHQPGVPIFRSTVSGHNGF